MTQVRLLRWGVLGGLAVLLSGFAVTVYGQNKPAPPSAPAARPQPAPQAPAPAAAPAQAAATPAPQASWTARCVSGSRQVPLECTLEQQIIVQNTGQQISFVSLRVPGDTRQPVAMIQLPLGLFLPAGLTIQVDEGKAQNVPIQSCDQRACYVGMPVPNDLLDGLKKGQRLKLTMQSLNREPVTIEHPLTDFAGQYQKIQ